MIENCTPSVDSIRRTRSAGTVEPPEHTVDSEDRSRVANSGCSMAAISMVGTASRCVPRSDSISSSSSAGSNCTMHTSAARRCTGPSTPSTQPPVWKSGIGFR